MSNEKKFDTLGTIINNSSYPMLELVLNNLPFGISVQNRKRMILFENSKAKELVGPYEGDHCFSRWDHIPNEGRSICQDCPATISLLDGVSHRIFRKTMNKDKNDLLIEIQVIPIIEKDKSVNLYIELINDVSEQGIIKSILNTPLAEMVNSIQFSISTYGDTGGEVFLKDNLQFFNNVDEYIQRLSMFTYIGVFQNNFNREGLFGPLPVLDVTSASMMVYSFRIPSSRATDPRRNGYEPCLLLTYFDRNYYFMFERRIEILHFLDKQFVGKKLEDLNEDWFGKFKREYKNLISKLMNKFEIKK